MSYSLENLTILQNFICTQELRLEMIRSEISKMSKIFEGCKFVVNYNSKQNLEQVERLYRENIPSQNLVFTNDIEPNFANTTIRQIENIETDYTLFMCEDFVYLEGQSYWEKMFREFVQKDLDFCMMAKIEKYAQPEWHENYEVGETLYTYHSSNSPTNRGVVSIDAIYKTENLLEMMNTLKPVKEIKMRDGAVSRYINMPNFYEEYFVAGNGMHSLDWKCSLPKELIVYSFHPGDQNERP